MIRRLFNVLWLGAGVWFIGLLLLINTDRILPQDEWLVWLVLIAPALIVGFLHYLVVPVFDDF